MPRSTHRTTPAPWRRRVTRAAGALSALLLVGVGATAPGLAAAATAKPADVASLSFTGHGYGHGRGMGQYGALGYALMGWSSARILDHYYGGTTGTGAPAPGSITVRLTGNDFQDTVVYQPGGLMTTNGVPSNAVRIHRTGAGAFEVSYGSSCTGPFGAPTAVSGTAVAVTPTAYSDTDRTHALQLCTSNGTITYRGNLIAVDTGSTQVTVNQLGTDDYVRGVVPREAVADWGSPATGGMAALEAQAVAARSYALADRRYGYADTCDSTSCQVYGGWATNGTVNENGYTDTAVRTTAGVVRRFTSGANSGAIARTEFSSSTGGYTAGGTFPAVPDDGDATASNPYHAWHRTVTADTITSALGNGLGAFQSMVINGRNNLPVGDGRITTVTLTFAGGTRQVSGTSFAYAVGLLDEWFSIDGQNDNGTPDAIQAKYQALGGAAALGPATSTETAVAGGTQQSFAYATIFASPATGAFAVQGLILQKYLALGGPAGVVGFPTTDETGTPDGAGRFNHFTGNGVGASIYWTPGTGAHEIQGDIRSRWANLGWEAGPLGYPVTDESGTPDGVGRFNHFSQGGSVYWTPSTGAHGVYGAIRAEWAATGWETGPMGYPTTDETGTPDRIGRFNHFTKAGSIYWTPTTGAHVIYGAIRATWAASGWETGPSGYPISDEYGVPGGRANDMQHGRLTFSFATRQVTAGP
ncbi:MAG: SpoIID/LytB domain [Mycobacterium sp.]|nr:SpoIID/LytB domain [Mycobacterium sp.]